MIRPFLILSPVLAIALAATPALAQSAGSMGTGTSGSDPSGLQTDVPNAVHQQTSGGSMNRPTGSSGSTGSTTAGTNDTGTGPGNTTGTQTSLPTAVGNQTPAGSPSAR